MSSPRKHEDAYQHATATAREVRLVVARQLQELVIEADKTGSRDEFVDRIRQANARVRQVAEARARQQQAREEGMPVSPAVRDEHEALSLLREAVMQAALAAATWVAAMDFEALRARDGALNGSLQSSRGRGADVDG